MEIHTAEHQIGLQVEGAARDQFLLQLLYALGRDAPDRVRRCPECQRLFVRDRKQQYCTRKCINRFLARKWRASEPVKEKRRQKARVTYGQKMREKLGKNVRVGGKRA